MFNHLLTSVYSLQVGPNYPHEPPKVKCETAVYHPNIDLEGNVCLNILREDWKPVLTVNSIVYGLQYLFLVCLQNKLFFFSSSALYKIGIIDLELIIDMKKMCVQLGDVSKTYVK